MSVQEMIEAVKAGNIEQVRTMLETGEHPNQHGPEQEWTPLNYAAGKGDLAMVKLLVEVGKAQVNRVGRDQRRPYQIARAADRKEVVQYLKEKEDQLRLSQKGNS